MAISAGMVWQIQSSGSDSNGGGFRGGCELSTPSAPSVSATSGGSIAVATYFVVVTLTTGNGETSKSAETSVTTTSSNKTITVTHPTDPSVQGATWNVYFGTTTGGPYFQGSSGIGLALTANYTISATPPTSGVQAPGTDRSLGNSPQVVVDNSTITCTTAGANSNVLTFTAGYTPTAADVGNVFHSTAGTNIRVGWYEITAWTSTTWTVTGGGNLTTAGGAGSAITGNMGGAFASPGGFGAADLLDGVTSQGVYINYNATPYTCSATANVSGGRLSSTHTNCLVGYDTTRTRDNTDTNRPILDAGAVSMTVITPAGNQSYTRNISVTNSAARTAVVGMSITGTVYNCKVDSCATGFLLATGNPGVVADCFANACGTGFSVAANCNLERCVSLGHTASGFSGTPQVNYAYCVAKGGTGTGFAAGGNFFACVSRDNSGGTSDGFTGTAAMSCVDCIAWSNGRTNYSPHTSATVNFYQTRIWNCAGGGSTANLGTAAGQTTGVQSIAVRNFVALTSDPHTNASGGDLSLNNISGGGFACRAAGLPGITSTTQLPGLSTLAYPDLGVAQHSDASAPQGPTGRIMNITNIGTY